MYCKIATINYKKPSLPGAVTRLAWVILSQTQSALGLIGFQAKQQQCTHTQTEQ